ncbi:uncharacterized protein TRAVEDRAFT_157597 [Trametes versicolor FP-101664 SS1]|uniref:uncharacterized protein n=1 Tax=Trametes versicolor (strain FP-101664) TaxID=717944 RepID=UPI000462373E|nr:uncharacterized protein TRAVEDRAFT_157597 [Trametes versicolor FP-101664 SS1]EIW63846.1 hypothetical protein TRAVEDRAFT_157597 [Trametes versicolor FP-101664 SS1]
MADTLAQHAPAIKVGGRRLSVTARPPKPVAAPVETHTAGSDTPVDYPRPAPPGEQQQLHKDEEEVPKKKQGNGGDEHERRIQESLYRKAEHNRPTREFKGNPKTAGARISQPAGKSLAM